MVFGKLWLRHTESGGEARRWVMSFRWHAERARDGQCCWLVAGLENLAAHPPVETRGRKRLILPKEKLEERLKILRQRARAAAKLRELMLAPGQRDIDEVIRIGSRLEEMKERISELGGVPRSWDSGAFIRR
ncbi:hypothetical protein LCGC14_0591360 [marine sediment metagenome]|uniref:Uncharacterized protein n=1 Tax=marine sediment metagenome TaxID=412755 RepID=A0A0F9RID3_9ZZZZ